MASAHDPSVNRWPVVVLAVIVFWTIMGVLQAASSYWFLDRKDVTFVQVWAITAIDTYTFALLTLPVMRLVHRAFEATWSVPTWLGMLSIAGGIYTVGHLVVYIAVVRFFDLGVMAQPPTFEAHLINALPRRLYVNACVFLGTAALALAVRYAEANRTRTLHAVQLEGQLAKAQVALLQRQMDAHFLFNTLHSAMELMHTDPGRAERMLMHLSTLLRRALREHQQHEVTVQDEVALLNHYIAIQHIRFEGRLDVQVTVDPAVESCFMPSLMLQTLVENAIRHGVSQRPEGGCVIVRVQQHADQLCLTIHDDGNAVGETWENGVGLANTHARLQALYGGKHTFEVDRRVDGGTMVRLMLPIHTVPVVPHTQPALGT
ncbi:MAG: hypothetical protein RhofKO_22820 [Rhodothermales bacterium]